MAPAIKARGGINVPLPGEIVSVMLSLAAATILTLFLSETEPMPLCYCTLSGSKRVTDGLFLCCAAQRALAIRSWRRTPYVVWCKWHHNGFTGFAKY